MKKKQVHVGRVSNLRAKGRIGLWGWFSLYLSGILLLFFLLTHIFTIHFGSRGVITARSVSDDFRFYFLPIINLGLLALCTFHGLVGFRRIILDLEILGKRGDRYLIYGLIISGLGLILFGVVIFNRFF